MQAPLFKRGLGLLLALGMTASMAACGANQSNDPQSSQSSAPLQSSQQAEPTEPLTPSPAPDTEEQGKTLIAYFSLWDNAPWGTVTDTDTSASVVVEGDSAIGTNEYVARMIQEATGGDLHAILAAEPYPADFDEVADINHQEDSRDISSVVEDMEQYDTVFIGYPVWATSLPQAVRTFLTEYDFTDKTVIPFCTHDGYGAGRSFDLVAELAAGAQTLDGIAIEASDVPTAQETVASWLSGLDLSGSSTQKPQGEAAIRITVDGMELEGVLYDSDMAQQFISQLPQTISMSNYGGREVYGGIDQEITVEGEGQLRFEDGDITYCPANNTAAIFYAQSARPNLTMEVYPIGKVTSDLSIFPDLPSRVDITFEIVS